jgi:predicted metal-dependent phosphoesterase TrpH
MTTSIDLHIHTYFSDGRDSPAEVLHRAAQMGIKTLAITDHDNANGAREALPLAQELGLELIPAVEFTCRWPECNTPPGKGDIDVLAYFVDLDDAEFQAFEQAALGDIHARIAESCAFLTMDGYTIFLEDVFAQNPRYAGLMQLMMAMQAKGYIPDWEEVITVVEQYWRRVRLSRFTIQELIDHIHRAGGVAVLAHPIAVNCDGSWISAEQLASLVEVGLDGLEIYHHTVDEITRPYFLHLAEQFDLLVTGGSDEHGWFSDLKKLGSQPVTAAMVDALRARHYVYNSNRHAQ